MVVRLELSVQNISCESCERVISRLVSRFNDAKFESISADGKTLLLSCNEKDVEKIKGVLSQYNYLEEQPVKFYAGFVAKQLFSDSSAFLAERTFLTRLLVVFGVIFSMLALFQIFVFNNIEVGKKLWPVLLLVPFGIILNMTSLWHARLLRKNFACNTGMMIGMTIGMMSGFMLGVILGATNGMFIGSVVSMFAGMFLGAWAGKPVGVMGVLEGMMAGLMGGLMGPMLSVMLITDNLIVFLYLFFIACTAIIVGLSYLIFRESGPIMDEKVVPSFTTMLFSALLVLILIVLLAMFGPKSAIAWGAL